MLTVAPRLQTNFAMEGRTLLFSMAQVMVAGKVQALEAVVTAISAALPTFFIFGYAFRLVKMKYKPGRVTTRCNNIPTYVAA